MQQHDRSIIAADVRYEDLSAAFEEMRPRLDSVEVHDNGEPLVQLDASLLLFTPHAYQTVGAPYGDRSPYYLRHGAHERLLQAEQLLSEHGYRLRVFDGYRPLAVQQFMVDLTFNEYRARADFSALSDEEIMLEVLKLWASPNSDPSKPPPHSTGGAVDVTLVLMDGTTVAMGGEIDECGPTQMPNHFRVINPEIHSRRELLRATMERVGFIGLLHEWWHFSYGDRHWAIRQPPAPDGAARSLYGRYE